MNELEEIKSKIDLVEYIGRYVQLKQGGRNFKGVCPFHSEKTPSFMVSAEKQIWHCFGACNEGGDIFSFVMKMEGMSFGEAVKYMADKTGVKLSNVSYEKSDEKKKLYSANQLAEDYYHENLFKPIGKKALDYLLKRGLTEATIKEFKLGYADGSQNDLIAELKKHGFTNKDMQDVSLASEKRGMLRDFFYNRLMFPIRDITGRCIAFSGRVLDDSLPKYINTAGNDIYDKSNVLFGIDVAKDSIRKADNVIFAEGNMDVIASSQAGIKNIVAPCGTALTEGQLKLVGRLTKNLKIAFDLDFAGSQATRRAIEIAWELGFNIKVIKVPAGKDPADAVKENPKEWKEAVKNSVYVVDYLFDSAFEKYSIKDTLGKKYIAKELLPVIKRLPDEIERNTYIKKLAEGLNVSEESVRDTLGKVSSSKKERKEVEYQPVPKKTMEMEGNILGLLAQYPHFMDFAANLLSADDFSEPKLGEYFQKMTEYYNKKGDFTEKAFVASLAKEQRDEFNVFILSAQKEFDDFDDEKKAEEIYFGIKRLKKTSLEAKKKNISFEVARLEKEGDEKGARKALESLQELLEEERTVI